MRKYIFYIYSRFNLQYHYEIPRLKSTGLGMDTVMKFAIQCWPFKHDTSFLVKEDSFALF